MKSSLFRILLVNLLFLPSLVFGQCPINITSIDQICNGDQLVLQATPNSGSEIITWTGPGLPVTGAANPATVNPTTTTTYTVYVTDPNTGCSNSTTFTVTVLPTPAPTYPFFKLCPNDPPVNFFSHPAAQSNTVWIINDPVNPPPPNSVSIVTVGAAEAFNFDPSLGTPGDVYSLLIHNDNGCESQVTFQIVDILNPFVPSTVCSTTPPFVMYTGIVGPPPGPPCGFWTYSNFAPGLINTATNVFNPAAATPGPNTFDVTFNSCFGPGCTETVTIFVGPPIDVTVVQDFAVCETDPPLTIAYQGPDQHYVESPLPAYFTPNTANTNNTSQFTPQQGLIIPTTTLGFVTFDPSSAALGPNPITYTINPGMACGDSETLIISVCPEPVINLSSTNGQCLLPTTLNANPTLITNGCPLSYSWTHNGTAINGGASLYVTQPGNYCVTVSSAPGCEITECITVSNTPQVSLNSVPAIQLCDWDGNNINLVGNSNGGSCSYSGPGVNPTTGQFNPLAAGGPGQYQVSYSCDINGCIGSASTTINVYDDNSWHQSTLNTSGSEVKNDVVTDADGNVYVTGEYTDETTLFGGAFPSEILPQGIPGNSNSFTAKYSPCGDLIWVNYSNNSGTNNNGTSLVLDENNGVVYAAGNYINDIEYEGPYGNPGAPYSIAATGAVNTSVNFPGGGSFGYVAQMDMSSGELYYISSVEILAFTEIRAITINENSGEPFVGGYVYEHPTYKHAFASKLIPVNGATLLDWQIISFADGDSYVNDLDFMEMGGSGRLGIIGEYNIDIHFEGLTNNGTYLQGNQVGVFDAFVCSVEDDNSGPQEIYMHPGNGEDGEMTGRGIAIDQINGVTFITGTYQTDVVNAFHQGYYIPNNITPNAYFVALDDAGNGAWQNAGYAEANNQDVKGVSVSHENNQSYFTGTYTGQSTFVGAAAVQLNYTSIGGSVGNEHIFFAAFNDAGAPIWANGTEDPISNTAVHLCKSVATDNNGNAFIVGSYSGDMDYILGNPASGVLTSTGGVNAFTMRSDLFNNGSFKSQDTAVQSETEQQSINNQGINLSLAPNPTSNQTLLTVVDYDSNLNYGFVLYGIDGKIILQDRIDAQGATIDLNDFEAGVYFIQVSNGTDIEVAKILKVD